MTGALWLLVALAQQTAPLPPPRSPDELVGERIRATFESPSRRDSLFERSAAGGFYARRAFKPAWSTEHGPNRLADDLVAALQRADLEGLTPGEYHLARIQGLLDSVRADAGAGMPSPPERLARVDLLLTDAFLLYGSHLLSGRVDPETLHPRWEANRRGADLAMVLQDALSARNVARALQRLAPPQDGYRRLREALVRERAIATAGGWPQLAAGAPPESIAARLRIEGDTSLRAFQARHGLDTTGVRDADTRAALNVTAEARVAQLRLNLERWRWLPQDLGRRRITVNIPSYELQVIEDEEVVLQMRVVVGRQYRRTPVFSDTVRYIVLNPFWYVPRTIAVEELLPKIQNDPSYLERFGMQVFQGSAPINPDSNDWATVTPDNFPYRVHQEPGRLNALGRIKFMFPNQYDVYLHDTPSRNLFNETQRDFSHGCIRVEKPIALATYLMRGNGRWNQKTIEAALDEGTERAIYLPRPEPIHLLYWTAWADEGGVIQFRPDIHELDPVLSAALDAPIKH
jgi:murein L,D-transpeptidase YcbB/YkuD